MNEFLKKLAEAIKAKADLDGVYTIKDFFVEQTYGEEYVADLHLRATDDGYITYQEGSWTETPLYYLSLAEVKRIASSLGL